MNENPEGTPNPLNPTPNLGSDPGAVSPSTVTVEQVESLDPTGRPMEKVVPVETPKKKSKVGLIIGIVIALVALIGAGVAAAIVAINMNKIDAVTAAMDKLMKGDTPKNIAIDGNIDILLNDKTSPIARLNVNLDSNIVTGSIINTSSAVLTITTKNNGEYSMKFDEVYATNGDLYFKIDGAIEALDGSGILEYLIADAEPGYYNAAIEVIETVDGDWLHISTDELDLVQDNVAVDSSVSCVTTLVNDVNKSSNSTFELYSKYPFIYSTNEGVKIASKGNPVYRVGIDSKNFTNFINSIQNTQLTNDLYRCLGWNNNVAVDLGEVEAIVDSLPVVYTEVNGNNDFVRLYMESDINDGIATVVIDLNFSYPNVVNISEPVEYTDFSDVIQEVMTSMFNLPGVETNVQSVTVEN